MKRYQVYLHPQTVSTLDEITEGKDLTRSQILREVADAAAARVGNLLAAIKGSPPGNYSELDELVGAIEVEGRKSRILSQNIDEIYYR